MSDDLRSATTDEGDGARDYDQGRNDKSLPDSTEHTDPSVEPQSEPSTSLTQNQAIPTVGARRSSGRQRRGISQTSAHRRGRGPTGSNTYRVFFASADALRDFRVSFQIPADVELELIPLDPSTHRPPHCHETIVPIFSICAASLRFPIQTFTREFLHVLDVTPTQLSLNTFRIVNGIAELKRIHNLEFTLDNLFGIYYIGQNPMAGRIFLSPRSTESVVNLFSTYGLPITSLPDSDKCANDFVFVRGNWEFSPNEHNVFPIPHTPKPAIDRALASTRQRYANWQRIEALFLIQDRAAPVLLGYVPNYNITLDQRWRQRRAKKLAAKEIAHSTTSVVPPTDTNRALAQSIRPPSPSHPLQGLKRLPLDRDSPDPFSSADDIMGHRFTPKSPLYTTGAPSALLSPTPRHKPLPTPMPILCLWNSNVGQLPLSENEADNLNRTEIPAENPDPNDIPWSPTLSYCNRPLKQNDSIRDNPGLSLALLKAVELPKNKARVEKEAGDAFVLALHHTFAALQEMTSVRDDLQERNKLLLGFEKKVKALTDKNARLKEENLKAKNDVDSTLNDAADSKKAVEELTQKYTEEAQRGTSLQAEVDKIPGLLKAKEDEVWDEADKTITKAYEDQVPDLLQYGYQFAWKAALEVAGVPPSSALYNEVSTYPQPMAPGASTSMVDPRADPKEIRQVTRDVPTIILDGQPLHEEPLL
ncbi:hypothetical protein Vadar_013651 [Vaccinium darrowii]|uniref:Uncharacterized protein n=1 Tax=Vaccinium darrowii TaxID=229202 RepID=A0ACB7X0M9_9ERIC|nr:hypothetical protein Vadar_013651 [Vaccinium darrowii]